MKNRRPGWRWQVPVVTINLIVCCWVFFATEGVLVRTWAQNPGGAGSTDLDKLVRLASKGQELRSTLAIHPVLRSSVWLDRRIDPQQVVDFSTPEQPLSKSIEQLATQIDAESLLVSPALMAIVPRGEAARLRGALVLARQQAAALKGTDKTAWNKSAPLTFELLDEPRDRATKWVSTAKWELTDPEAIPHDLWPAFDGPPLALAERLQLLLFGFNLTFELDVDERKVRVVELPVELRYKELYRPKGNLPKVVADLKKRFPDASVTLRDKAVEVTASAEDHHAIAPALSTDRPLAGVGTKSGEKRFSLKVENQPIGAVIKTVASELKLELVAESDVAAAMQQLVSFDAVQLPLDKLLEQALKPAKLKATIEKDKLRVDWIDP